MRIVYGIHGYSRGHATRALSILPDLFQQHDVRLYAGGDAYALLSSRFEIQQIPCLTYAYDNSGRISLRYTIKENFPKVLDLCAKGDHMRQVLRDLEEFKPDVVISDAEAWTHRAAEALKIPRVSFDHFGIMTHCRLPMPITDRILSSIDRLLYKMITGRPDRVLLSSFYEAPLRTRHAKIIGPLLRDEVHDVASTDGEHLLVYLNNGVCQLTPNIQNALFECGMPVRFYGTGQSCREANIDFRPFSNTSFLEDLASARAVVCTAGNQLVGEAIHFGKPLLVLPELTVEQRLNARAISRMGIGRVTTFRALSSAIIREFVGELPRYRTQIALYRRDGKSEALRTLEAWFTELKNGRRIARGRRVLQVAT